MTQEAKRHMKMWGRWALRMKQILRKEPIRTTVTQEEVNSVMRTFTYWTHCDFGKPTTYAAVKLKNGFTLRDSTTCVDPDNYSEEIGAKALRERLEDKVWFALGLLKQEELYKAGLL